MTILIHDFLEPIISKITVFCVEMKYFDWFNAMNEQMLKKLKHIYILKLFQNRRKDIPNKIEAIECH